jgi:molybdenum cofactor cytidylyltransferase
MTAAAWAYPELIRSPGFTRPRIPHVHFGSAALTPDVASDVRHAAILTLQNCRWQAHRNTGEKPASDAHDRNLYDLSVIPGIVLAAGRSSRMGRLKPNLPVRNGTFLTRVVETFLDAGVSDVVIVVGHEHEAVVGAFMPSGLPARFVINPDHAGGQLSSLLAGLRVIDRPGVIAALITLVDVPFVSAATVRAVMDRYRATHAPIVRPTHGTRHGHPLLVDRSLFEALRRADPGHGAKETVRQHATEAGDVEVEDEGAFTDIDTPEAYALAAGRFDGVGRDA